MTPDQAIDLVRETFTMMLMVSGPVLGAALVVGLVISLFQAVTQIQEQTLTFVPKIVSMAAIAIFTLPWMLNLMKQFAVRMFGGMS